MGRPGIRCVAIYWKQLRLTLDLCFLSYPIWNLTSWRSKGETTFTIIYIHLLSVFLLTSARPNSNRCILQQYSSSKLGAQAIPLKTLVSRTGEGHSIQILSVATLQAKRIVYYPNIALIDWLTCYLWSLIPTFPGLRPRAIFVRGVHRGAFAQQQLRSRHVAVARRLVQRRHASGGFFPFNRQTNDECFGFNSFKLCKAKYIHTQSQTHRTSFMACCFQQITFNETLSIINSLIVCFQKLKRLWKTMSSTKSNS